MGCPRQFPSIKVRGEGYEHVHTSTIERFYSCFFQFEPFFQFIVLSVLIMLALLITEERVSMVVEQNPIVMAGSEVCALNFIHFGLVIGLKRGVLTFFRCLTPFKPSSKVRVGSGVPTPIY